jgi:KTSC domain
MRARRLESSLIDRIVFDDEALTLAVLFRNGRRYIYQGVPRAIYDAFGKAASAGRFFNDQVKGHFACREVGGRKRYPLE